jgi:hypothetical protein
MIGPSSSSLITAVAATSRLAKQGSRHLRWALIEAANHSHPSTSPDHELSASTVRRRGRGRARLTVRRKIARRSYHVPLAAQAA